MYCPKCAQPNGDEAKYCRACGENLTAFGHAMSKHWPVMLASKLDEHIERKDHRLRRDGAMTGLSGIFLLLSGVWSVASNPAAWLPAVLMFVGALILLLASGWDMLAYRRSNSRNAKNARLGPSVETGKLEASSPRQIPQASVTELTTRHLDRAARRSGEFS